MMFNYLVFWSFALSIKSISDQCSFRSYFFFRPIVIWLIIVFSIKFQSNVFDHMYLIKCIRSNFCHSIIFFFITRNKKQKPLETKLYFELQWSHNCFHHPEIVHQLRATFGSLTMDYNNLKPYYFKSKYFHWLLSNISWLYIKTFAGNIGSQFKKCF